MNWLKSFWSMVNLSLKNLKRFKDEVENVQSGQECGMAFSDYEDIKADDVIEIFKVDNIARTFN